jgi:hypothetical protein
MTNSKQQTEMNKEFIPYELALSLKQLGFDEPCLFYYYGSNDLQSLIQIDMPRLVNHNESILGTCYSAPSYSQAFRWFREKHNLRCQINYIGGLINETTWWDISIIGHYNTDPKEWEMKYQPYEEAELACLKKLIEIANDKQ